jgi:acetyl esterase/lipase
MQDPPDGALGAWFAQLELWDRLRAAPEEAPQVVRYGPGAERVADLWLPSGPGPHPVLVSLHGGFFRGEYRRNLHDSISRELSRGGVAVLNVEYRRIGCGGGPVTTTADVWAAVDWVAGKPWAIADRVAVFGHSAGGYLAAWLANHPLVDLAVVLAGVTDLVDSSISGNDGGAIADWLGVRSHDADAFDQAAFDQAALAGRLPTGARLVFIHGDLDLTVPSGQSIRFAAAAIAAGDAVQLDVLPDDGHYAFLDPREPAFEVVREHLMVWAEAIRSFVI